MIGVRCSALGVRPPRFHTPSAHHTSIYSSSATHVPTRPHTRPVVNGEHIVRFAQDAMLAAETGTAFGVLSSNDPPLEHPSQSNHNVKPVWMVIGLNNSHASVLKSHEVPAIKIPSKEPRVPKVHKRSSVTPTPPTNSSDETKVKPERRTEKKEKSRKLAMTDVKGVAPAEETKDAGGSTVATDSPPSRVVLAGAPGSWNKLMGEYELQSK